MRRVAVDHVQAGMITGQHIFPPGETTGLPLLATGVVITEALRDRLIRSGIDAIAVDDELSAGIELDQPISDATRQKAVTVVEKTFDMMKNEGSVLGRTQLRRVESVMNAILAEIAGRKNLLVCLSDLNRFGGDRIQHAVNVCVMGSNIARHYFSVHGWRDYKGNRRDDRIPERMMKLGVGLMLADIGMLSVPESIRAKKSSLSAEERALVQQHPMFALDLLEGTEVSPLTKVTIAQHHERFNGTGYPRRLSGDEIHDHGAIAGISEAYITLCETVGPDGERFEPHDAWDLIVKASDKLFPAAVVESFRATVAPYGPGTSVLLSDGRHGVISDNHPDLPLRPTIRVTHDRDGLLYPIPCPIVDLGAVADVRIVAPTTSLPSDRPVSQV